MGNPGGTELRCRSRRGRSALSFPHPRPGHQGRIPVVVATPQ
jgi:hypothetical protein